MSAIATSPRSRLAGGALIAAPALLVVSTIAYVAGGELGVDGAGGVIQIYAAALFLPAIVALTRVLDAPAPRAAAVLLLIGSIGVAGAVAYGLNAVYADAGPLNLNEDPNSAAPFALNVPGVLFPLTFIGLGIALTRARVEPRWSGIALALGGVLFPMSRIPGIEPLALVADGFLLVALVPLGWALVQGRDPMASAAGTRLRAPAGPTTAAGAR